ncbi:hypothetical protein D039_1796A, partial [Vibrio parahaemolyticus EKP-028]|jgi:hypothetical protein
MWLLG